MQVDNGAKACLTETPSPFKNINEQLDKQNYEFGELVNRLRVKLHKLSDTNFPTAENKEPPPTEDLPFHEGHLKEYYYKVKNNNSIIRQLEEQVIKLEALI